MTSPEGEEAGSRGLFQGAQAWGPELTATQDEAWEPPSFSLSNDRDSGFKGQTRGGICSLHLSSPKPGGCVPAQGVQQGLSTLPEPASLQTFPPS